MVVAQLVERLLSKPEIRGSNPVIGKNLFISNICLLSTVYWKDENKEKETGNGPFFLKKRKKDNNSEMEAENGPNLFKVGFLPIEGLEKNRDIFR